MNELFTVIQKCSLAGSYAIVLVYAVRFFLRKYPKSFSYFLWFAVFFRLVCPISFNTSFSIVPESISYPDRIEQTEVQVSSSNETLIESLPVEQSSQSTQMNPQIKASSFEELVVFIWMLGVLVLWGYSFISFAALKRKLKNSLQIEANVYQSTEISSPFVLGLIHPKIYLPKHIKEDELDYILMHERFHILRKDYIMKPVSFLILCLHWFNPLVWTAWFSLSKDMEMSCDEAVIQKMGNEIKKEYSLSLLKIASSKTLFNASPLAFSDHNAKNRIMNVLNYKKPAFWLMSILAVLISAFTISLSTNKYKSPQIKAVLEDLSSYLKTDTNQIEVIDVKTKGSIKIVTCTKTSQKDSEHFFLIFKDGELETCYFNCSENPDYAFYTFEAAEEIARQYVQDVYHVDVSFEEYLHLGRLYEMGPEMAGTRSVAHFVSDSSTFEIHVSICTATGEIVASSISPLWDDTWMYAHQNESIDNYGLLAADDYIILSKDDLILDIWPAQRSKQSISFNNTSISTQSAFSITFKGQQIEFNPFSSELSHSFYGLNLQTRCHADVNTEGDLNMLISRLRNEYRVSKDKEQYMNAKKSLLSYAAALLEDNKKTNLSLQWQLQMDMIDQLIPSTQNVYTSTSNSTTGFYDSSTNKLLGEYTELYLLVIENGQFKIDKAITIPSEAFWKTIYYNDSEELIQKFMDAFTYKDLSTIYHMMEYQDNAKEMAQTFLNLEFKAVQLETLEVSENTASAQISFKIVHRQTDEMGTTSASETKYLLTLDLIETENGWIIKNSTAQEGI